MNPGYMLDTDTCVYIARGKHNHIAARLSEIPSERVSISSVTYGELAYGAAKSKLADRARQSLEELVVQTSILPVDKWVAAAYGKIRASLDRQGLMIGPNDLWIGSHALTLGLILVTNNEREFRRIDGLAIENWVKP